MLFNIPYFDDEQVKLSILQERVHLCVSRQIELGDHAYLEAELKDALNEELDYTIEFYYWQYPSLARCLRDWIDNAMQTRRDVDETNAVSDAIRNKMPAPQLESLLELLNE